MERLESASNPGELAPHRVPHIGIQIGGQKAKSELRASPKGMILRSASCMRAARVHRHLFSI
jgi:hypothetical protein